MEILCITIVLKQKRKQTKRKQKMTTQQTLNLYVKGFTRTRTCLGTSRLFWVFISAPVGVRERVNVVLKRCIVLAAVDYHAFGFRFTGWEQQQKKNYSFCCFIKLLRGSELLLFDVDILLLEYFLLFYTLWRRMVPVTLTVGWCCCSSSDSLELQYFLRQCPWNVDFHRKTFLQNVYFYCCCCCCRYRLLFYRLYEYYYYVCCFCCCCCCLRSLW